MFKRLAVSGLVLTFFAVSTVTAQSERHAGGTYYVRAREGETYIIEYKGHQLTAHCREALTWLHGEGLGSPMTENACMYLNDKVGQHLDEDFMVRVDNELRYRVFGHFFTSVPVADVLDITDDVLIGAPKLSQSAPKTSPEILKTLLWIGNTLKDNEGETQYPGADGSLSNHINLMTEPNGCQVTFIDETMVVKKSQPAVETFHSRAQVNLGDLDPNSITSDESAPEIGGGPVSTVRVNTTDKTPSISEGVDRVWEPIPVAQTTNISWELPSPYAARFVKALRRAVTLCGGKASAF